MDENFFADRVADLRIQKGVSAREMSLSLGLSENYINMVENKKIFPSLDSFFIICEYFEINPSDFYNDGKKNPTLLNELMQESMKLDEVSLKHIIEIIKGINKKK